MSRKISDFFTKKSIKSESRENLEIENQNCKSEAEFSVKLEAKEKCSNKNEITPESPQNLTSNENPGLEIQSKIIENVKSEAKKQLLIILPQQKIQIFPVPIKIENIEPKKDELLCQICKKIFETARALSTHEYIHDKKFECTICNKKFPTKPHLLRHIRYIHENPGSFKCDVCKVGFNKKENLKAHQKIHKKIRPKPFKCIKCDYATDYKGSLKGHLKTHERIIERCEKCNKILIKNKTHDCRLDCKYCGKEFSHSVSVIQHIKEHHAQEIERSLYKCDICGLKLYLKNALRIHMDMKHADGKIQTFTCDLDGKTFSSKKKIVQHMKCHLLLVKCEFCDHKGSIRMLKDHIVTFHTGIKRPRKQVKKPATKDENYQCHICSKILSTKSSLNVHISDHNKKIKCKFCGKLFGNKSNLKIHIRDYHENPKSFICEMCDQKFTRAAHLKSHMKTHDPNRPKDLKCSQCDYATDNKQSFKAHLKFHERKNAEIAAIKNPHKCPQCPAITKSQKKLDHHMYSVHRKFLVECDICGKQMKSKSKILRHLRGVHKIR